MSSQSNNNEDGEGAGKVVCVTGGSGYIASWLVNLLLQRGYIVNTTVRDPNDEKKTAHLRSLDGAGERLHLFKAELLEEGSFDSAVAGCVGVFHTASPVPLHVVLADPQAELIDPAVKGTLNVLKSCAKVSTIKRVILTSSLAAVGTGQPLTPDVVIDETWFADPEIQKEQKKWYPLSKTLAEKAAWKFAEENNINLVSLNPGFVIGPLLQPTLNGSVEIILRLVDGAQTYPEMLFESVDVRDVALAHILAFEIPSASGRYILVERGSYMSELANILRQLYPTLSLPEKFDRNGTNANFMVSQEKAKSLGIKYTPLEVSLKDTIESFKEKGFLSF